MVEYNGTIDLISGIRPKNNGKFPLVNAKDVQVDNTGKRLDTKLDELSQQVIEVNQAVEENSNNLNTANEAITSLTDEVQVVKQDLIDLEETINNIEDTIIDTVGGTTDVNPTPNTIVVRTDDGKIIVATSETDLESFNAYEAVPRIYIDSLIDELKEQLPNYINIEFIDGGTAERFIK